MRYPSQLTVLQAADRALHPLGLTTADTLMSARGTAAIFASVQHWNNAALWEFALTSRVCSAAAGYAFQMPGYDRPLTFEDAFPSPSASVPPRARSLADAIVANSSATGNAWVTATGFEYRYYVPQNNVRAIYNMRDMTQPRTLYFMNKLRIDRANPTHTWDAGELGDTPAMDTPIYWDWSLAGGGQFRLLPVQDQTTEVLVRYFRHLELYPAQGPYYLYWYSTSDSILEPLVSGTGYAGSAGAMLDIPIMYEDYVICHAAARLLRTHTDKLDLAKELQGYADSGLALAINDNNKHKLDEDVVLVPNNEDPSPLPLSYENLTRYQVDSLR